MSGRVRVRFLDTRPLRGSRPFRDLWIGTSVSQVGGQIATVAVLAQVWDLTGSPVGTGAIGLATGLPMVLFGLLGGTLADTVDRRAVVRATTAGQLLAAAALCAQALADNRNVLLLLALVALGTSCGALGAPARRTFPVRLLPGDQVAAGLALTNISFQAAMLTGPALAGLIIARWDFAAAYAAQAAAMAVSMLAVLRLPAMRPEGAGAAGGRRRPERGGWRIVLRRPTLWGSMATDLSATLLAMPIALFPLVNETRFGVTRRPSACSSRPSRSGDHGRSALRYGDTPAPCRPGAALRSRCLGPGPGLFRSGGAVVAGARLPGRGGRCRHRVGRHPQHPGANGNPGRIPGTGLLCGTRHRCRGPRTRQLPRWPVGIGHLRLLLAGLRRTVRRPGDRRRGRDQRASPRLPHAARHREADAPGPADAAAAAGQVS
ncbi:hypothetical protein SHKM778_73570 [Streptomyces sp. KM77-8]|uniref:MFS transporter n=1 Tax=Streptomyces haneummycinicus TaxID=3074435 RepID=A0AAT9HUK2_9ACTN